MSSANELNRLCEQGQRELALTRYLDAERFLIDAERLALSVRDYDSLSRLYMPLQEARRQRRQRCGEGTIRFDLMARSPDQTLDAPSIVERYPQGQLIVAAWGSIGPAIEVRRLAHERKLYLETFLAASFPVIDERDEHRHVVVIVPNADAMLPVPTPQPAEQLLASLPANSILIPDSGLAAGEHKGDDETYAQTMALWERLHTPYVAAGDDAQYPIEKIEHYRRAIDVDYACEFAHQRLSRAARMMVQK